jgi:hypothetical protein
MSKIEALSTNSGDSPVGSSRLLAAARGATLAPAADELAMSHVPLWTAIPTPGASPRLRREHTEQPSAPIAPDRRARDMAEIEQAAAALRRAEPTLEPRRPGLDTMPDVRSVRSVWFLIALIWLSAASVVSSAIGAVLLLLG